MLRPPVMSDSWNDPSYGAPTPTRDTREPRARKT